MSSAPRNDRPAPELLHRERLLPSPGTWIVLASLGAVFGVVLVPLSLTLAAIVAPLGAIALCVLGWVTSPVISVSHEELMAGRARISPDHLGEPETLDREGWTRVMGTAFEPLSYHCTRGWIHTGVRIPLDDDDDPAPAWVVSSRRPADLARALHAAGDGA